MTILGLGYNLGQYSTSRGVLHGKKPQKDRKMEASSLKAHSGAGKLYSKGHISILLGVPVPSNLSDYTHPEQRASFCVLLD